MRVRFRPEADALISIEFEQLELHTQMVPCISLIHRMPGVPNYFPCTIGLFLQNVDVAII